MGKRSKQTINIVTLKHRAVPATPQNEEARYRRMQPVPPVDGGEPPFRRVEVHEEACEACGGPCREGDDHGQEGPERPWRVGRKVGRTLYRGDTLIGVMDTPDLAAAVVAAVNAKPDPTGEAIALLRDFYNWSAEGPINLSAEDREKLRKVLDGQALPANQV